MLTAIQFDDEFLTRSTKVNNIVSNSMLITKVNITHLMSA